MGNWKDDEDDTDDRGHHMQKNIRRTPQDLISHGSTIQPTGQTGRDIQDHPMDQ